MNFARRRQEAAQLLDDMKRLVDSLPENKRTELIAALKEIFSELDLTAVPSRRPKESTQCFARV